MNVSVNLAEEYSKVTKFISDKEEAKDIFNQLLTVKKNSTHRDQFYCLLDALIVIILSLFGINIVFQIAYVARFLARKLSLIRASRKISKYKNSNENRVAFVA